MISERDDSNWCEIKGIQYGLNETNTKLTLTLNINCFGDTKYPMKATLETGSSSQHRH